MNGEFIKEWDNAIDASKALNIDKGNIHRCYSHVPKHYSAGGYIWRRSDDNTPVTKFTDNSIV
jgi:hypothetical protein